MDGLIQGSGLEIRGAGGDLGISAPEIGTPPTLFDGTASPSIYAMLTAMADSSGGSDFTSVDNCLVTISDASGGGGGGGGDVNVVSIDGQPTSGNNAVLNLQQLNIQNHSGHAILAHSTGGNGNALDASGSGTGNGFDIRAGYSFATALRLEGQYPLECVISRDGGTGIRVTNTGPAVTNSTGMYLQSSGTGTGLLIQNPGPFGTGKGVLIRGGYLGGAGLVIGDDVKSTATNGIEIGAYGSGSAIVATGGATGNGVEMIGGSTSGHGLALSATSGNALDATGGGSGHGFDIRAGLTGNGIDTAGGLQSGDGIFTHATAASFTGNGIRSWGRNNGSGVNFGGGSTGNGITAAGGISGGTGLDIIGLNGVGLKVQSGASSNGVEISGGYVTGHGIAISATSGNALDASGGGSGDGFHIRAGATGHGFRVSTTDGHGLWVDANGSNRFGMQISSGSSVGALFAGDTHGIEAWGLNGNGAKIYSTGTDGLELKSFAGNGHGVSITGHGTGNGVKIAGGTTGNGVLISTTDGYGVDISAQGSARHGVRVTTTNGTGIFVDANGAANSGMSITSAAGHGVLIAGTLGVQIGGSTMEGVKVTGSTDGVSVASTGIGSGLKVLGGPSGGDAFYCAAQGGNSNGASFNKAGSGVDIDADEVTGLLKLTSTIDGVTTETVLEYIQAMANGRFLKHVPVANDITFYKRDNTTPLFVVHVTDTERTRL